MPATTVSSIIGSSGLLPPGTIIPHAGVLPPSGFLLCDGTSYLRTAYPSLFSSITLQLTAATTNSSTSVTLADTSKLAVGWGVEGAGIGAGATVASILNANTITLSAAATTTSASNTLTFLPHGRVSTTTFNVPDARGVFLRGAGTSGISNYGGVSGHQPSAGAVGAKGGQKTAVNGLLAQVSSVQVSGNTSTTGGHTHGSNADGGTSTSDLGLARVSRGGTNEAVTPTSMDSSAPTGAETDIKNSGGYPLTIDTAGAHAHTVSLFGSADGQEILGDDETTPAYFAVNHIIKI